MTLANVLKIASQRSVRNNANYSRTYAISNRVRDGDKLHNNERLSEVT